MGELVKIFDKKDVAPGSSTAVEVRGQKVAVFNVDGTFYAISVPQSDLTDPGAGFQGRGTRWNSRQLRNWRTRTGKPEVGLGDRPKKIWFRAEHELKKSRAL